MGTGSGSGAATRLAGPGSRAQASTETFAQKVENYLHWTVSIIVNSGYVVSKDRRVVIFYTNDLHDTVPARWLPSSDSRAVTCCHGPYPIKRWTGNEMLNRRTFMVPAIVGAYNLAMTAVDRVDQLRSTNPTRRKEARLLMPIFTWALDLCVINAFALYREVRPEEARDIGLREFKRRIAESLTEKELNRRRNSRPQRVSVATTVGAATSHHILSPNTTENSSGQLLCMLCGMRGKRLRARWGCTECGRGFHVECFAALHFRDIFTAATPSVRHALDIVASAAAVEAPFKTRKRKNAFITPIKDLMLPA